VRPVVEQSRITRIDIDGAQERPCVRATTVTPAASSTASATTNHRRSGASSVPHCPERRDGRGSRGRPREQRERELAGRSFTSREPGDSV
jgi:hypothetical protein